MSRVAVAGAGLTGALLASRLANIGHEVTVFDRRRDLRIFDVDAGRSINLAVSTRGLDALDRIGVLDAVLEHSTPMPGRLIHATDGATAFQPYGTQSHHVLHSVDRDHLNGVLLDALDKAGATARFEHRVRDLSVRRGELKLETPSGTSEESFDVIYGCDGAYSAVRGRLQRIGRVDFAQTFLSHGYKELTIPAAPDGAFALDPNALHIWPRGSHMLIALPNPDGSFTGTLFWPFAGEVGFDSVDESDIGSIFERWFGDVAELIPDLADQYRDNPTSELVTIRTGPWFHEGHALLLGDAAHAVVPFYGQGANAALEDVTILMDLYDKLGVEAHHRVFEAFYAERKPQTDALGDLAIEHFTEMADSVGSGWFRLGKLAERVAARLAPSRYTSLYTAVSFTRTPYQQAVASDRRQRATLRSVSLGVVVIALALVIALVVSFAA